MNILITGGAGFIGSRLAISLIGDGHNVRILDNFNSQIHGNSAPSLQRTFSAHGIEVIAGDIRSKEEVGAALKDVQSIVHLASETGTGQSMYQISNYADTNVIGTCNLVEQIITAKSDIDCLIIASTRAVYGEGKYLCNEHGIQVPESRIPSQLIAGVYDPVCRFCQKPMTPAATDEYTPTNPKSIYGITKLAQEQIAMTALSAIGVKTIALRLQNVFGPGQSLNNPYTGILSIFSKQMTNNLPIYIFEDGQESRDFVYVDDVVTAIRLALFGKKLTETIFNVGCGSMTSVLDLVNKLKSVYESNSDVVITGEYRIGDIRHNYADTKRSREVLKFEPSISLDQGLQRFAKWVLQQPTLDNEYEKSLRELRTLGLLQG